MKLDFLSNVHLNCMSLDDEVERVKWCFIFLVCHLSYQYTSCFVRLISPHFSWDAYPREEHLFSCSFFLFSPQLVSATSALIAIFTHRLNQSQATLKGLVYLSSHNSFRNGFLCYISRFPHFAFVSPGNGFELHCRVRQEMQYPCLSGSLFPLHASKHKRNKDIVP